MRILSALVFLSALQFGNSAWAIQAQPVPIPEDQSVAPQINISGTGIGTLGYGKSAEQARSRARLNFSDSALQVGGAQRLYGNDGVGSFGLGAVTTDESNRGTGTSLFLHQMFVDYQTESFETLLGRSDNPTAHLVDFPTLRGDDLVGLTNPQNPFSNGENAEEHRYSNVASITFNQKLKYFENFHVQHLIDSSRTSTDTDINSYGVSFGRLGEPGFEALEFSPSWGVGYEHIAQVPGTSNGLHQLYAGGTFNLKPSATRRIELGLQNIYSWGSSLRSFQNVTDSYRANSNTFAASIRYLATPFGGVDYQIALTLAQKNYLKVANATARGFAITGVKRLGPGFDFVAQYQGQARKSALANVQSHGTAFEQVGEVGLSFNFDAVFNEHISPRRSILNQSHGYIRD